jgi:hypothetical protein
MAKGKKKAAGKAKSPASKAAPKRKLSVTKRSVKDLSASKARSVKGGATLGTTGLSEGIIKFGNYVKSPVDTFIKAPLDKFQKI